MNKKFFKKGFGILTFLKYKVNWKGTQKLVLVAG